MAESIDIEVRDRVADSIRTKILNISQAALEGYNNISRLQTVLNTLNVNKIVASATNAATASERLAAAVARTATAQTNAESAVQRLATATAKTTRAQAQAATATQALSNAQTQGARAAAQAATAQSQAALAALRLANAQNQGAKAASNHAESFIGFIRNIAGAVGAGIGIKAIVDMGDAYTTLQNKLQNVSTSQEQVNELTTRLFDVANRTRQPIEETATAFVRFDRSLKSLGKGQEDTLRLTETVNKALIVSGATASESASALLQLSQAFNSGKLQGDEFRSVSENLPIVLDAIAKATNTPINQVKRLAKEGKITAEVLFNAFKLLGPQVDATFGKTIPTVAQAIVEFKNKSLEAFGAFNKASGFTEGIAKAIEFLANNMKLLSVVTTTLGVAFLAAFGPQVVAAITTVTTALLANPLAIVAVAIVAATVALFQFGDQLTVIEADGITLLDVFKGAFRVIIDGALAVVDFFKTGFTAAIEIIDSILPSIGGVGTFFADTFKKILDIARSHINFIIGFIAALGDSIKIIVGNFPSLFQAAFASVVNFGAAAVETLVNSFQIGFRLIAKGLESIAPNLSESLNGALDAITLKLPRLDVKQEGKDAAKDLLDSIKADISRDYVGEVGGAILKASQNVARNRTEQALLAGSTGNLRGAGVNTNVADPGKTSSKKTRAELLAHENAEIQKQISGYGLLADARDVQSKLDEIEIKLADKRFSKLGVVEREVLRQTLEQAEAQKQVQKSADSIYNDVAGPQKAYANNIAGINLLLKNNNITTDQAAEATRKATYEYQQATDPLFEFNKGLDDQNRLLDFNSKEREVQSQVLSLVNSLAAKGKTLSDEQVAGLTAELTALQKRNDVMKEYDSIQQSTQGAQETIVNQIAATNLAYERGVISLDNYNQRMVDLKVNFANLNLTNGIGTFEDSVISSLGRIREGFTNVTKGLTDSFGSFFVSVSDGFANSIGRAIVYGDNLRDSLREVARSALSELISSLVKVGIQYLINAAIGNTALATATAAQVAAASVVATAWAPAAALVSLASFGGNAAPAITGLVATDAVAQVLAKVPGFSEGGFTGNGATDAIAGVVHGGEFVNNAASTARNRSTLEAMNRGETVGIGGDIVIEDHTSGGVNFERAPSLTAGEVRMIARDVVASDAGKVISGELGQPNSPTSKALRNTHQVQRKR